VHAQRARDQLYRHGLNWSKACTVTDVLHHAIVHVPKFGPRLFGGLCRYERMHVYYQNYCDYAMEALIKCVRSEHYPAVHAVVLACHHFRDPTTGAPHPRLPFLLKMTHMTAERRCRAIFYWAHVVGLKAEVIDAPVRIHAQNVIALLQLILIATRGHRAYTPAELESIFEHAGRQFFCHLERIAEYNHNIRIRRAQQRHERNPDDNPAPVPFKRAKRFVYERQKLYTNRSYTYV